MYQKGHAACGGKEYLASEIIHVLVTLGVLMFAAKLVARLASRMGQPAVLGEIVAGILVGSLALVGALPLVDGQPLVVIDAAVVQVGEIAAIIILFVAGMQTTPREFLKLGAPSFAVGALGVVVPFFAGYFVLGAPRRACHARNHRGNRPDCHQHRNLGAGAQRAWPARLP